MSSFLLGQFMWLLCQRNGDVKGIHLSFMSTVLREWGMIRFMLDHRSLIKVDRVPSMRARFFSADHDLRPAFVANRPDFKVLAGLEV